MPRYPQGLAPHDLGGGFHNADVIADLNNKVSDATLDDSSATRTPSAHGAAQHTNVTREMFMSAGEAHPSGTNVIHNLKDRMHIIEMPDNQNSYARFTMKVPDDFVSFTSLKAVWGSDAAAGNMYWHIYVHYAASTEAYDTHAETPGKVATATGGTKVINEQAPGDPVPFTNLATGDYIGITFFRDGDDALDTLGDIVYLMGTLFTYTASQ